MIGSRRIPGKSRDAGLFWSFVPLDSPSVYITNIAFFSRRVGGEGVAGYGRQPARLATVRSHDARPVSCPQTTASYIPNPRDLLCATQLAMAGTGPVEMERFAHCSAIRRVRSTTATQLNQIPSVKTAYATPCHCCRSPHSPL